MMRIAQLLTADMLLPEAYVDRVEVARRRPDLSMEILAVDLKKAWSGDASQDLLLKPLDEVTVRTELKAARTVQLSGQVVRPGVYTISEGERLSSVLERAGGFSDRAFLKGALFTRAALRKTEQEQVDAFLKVQEQRLLSTASTVTVGAEKEEIASQQQALQARRDMLKILASKVVVGRMVVHLDTPDKLKGTDNDVVLTDGDTLSVPEPPQSVLVLGAVRNSTSVQYKEGAGVDYYINRVGGFSREADQKEAHIVKADGSAISSFTNVRNIEPGDTVIVRVISSCEVPCGSSRSRCRSRSSPRAPRASRACPRRSTWRSSACTARATSSSSCAGRRLPTRRSSRCTRASVGRGPRAHRPCGSSARRRPRRSTTSSA
jgi:protein involved in polysaccharide export with SLBB domain